jgi:hypothetical protein
MHVYFTSKEANQLLESPFDFKNRCEMSYYVVSRLMYLYGLLFTHTVDRLNPPCYPMPHMVGGLPQVTPRGNKT